MKLDTPEFKALFTPELQQLAQIFEKYKHELRIAGGAVRDLLMNQQPKDIDFASTATPEEMKDIFNKEGIRMINTRGESHGTITARLNDKENFEVTTLRIDVITDGRHAEVQFTKDWELDANRRDLTINSLFLGLDGTVYDYFNGIEDLKMRRVAFVGDPVTRIREDYLRILRYFRFYGRISTEPDKHELTTLLAIKENIAGLKGISGERIWMELKKILNGNFAKYLIPRMLEAEIASHIGLPDIVNVDKFVSVCDKSTNLSPNAITLLAALLKDEEQMMHLHNRLKFSAYERDLGLFLVVHRDDKPHKIPLRPYQLIQIHSKATFKHVHEWICEVLKYRGDIDLLEEFQNTQLPKFPVNGNMLKDAGVKSGKQYSLLLKTLKDQWAESNFSLSKDELMSNLETVLKQLDIKT